MRVVQRESFLDGTGVIVEGRGSRQRGGVLGTARPMNNAKKTDLSRHDRPVFCYLSIVTVEMLSAGSSIYHH